MARPKLPVDSTLSDIATKLDNAVEYVRGSFGNMVDYRKEHGSAVLRIGITGTGIVPNYRIEPEGDMEDYVKDMIADDVAKHYVAFNGRSHKRLDWGIEELRGNHWSQRGTNFEDVQKLLGALRRDAKS